MLFAVWLRWCEVDNTHAVANNPQIFQYRGQWHLHYITFDGATRVIRRAKPSPTWGEAVQKLETAYWLGNVLVNRARRTEPLDSTATLPTTLLALLVAGAGGIPSKLYHDWMYVPGAARKCINTRTGESGWDVDRFGTPF